MYSIDGFALDNTGLQWRLKAATMPEPQHSRTLADLNASGRDGTVQVRGFIATPTVTLAVTTIGTNLDALRKLFRLGKSLTLTADATKFLNIELQSLTTEKWTDGGASGGIFYVVAVFRCPDVFWRDVSTTDYGPTTITSTPQTFTCFSPSTAPVRDALICVQGSITGLVVAGANSTYFGYAPVVGSSTFLTFDAAAGRAWTGASAFAKTTEVTASVTNGPWPYFLELEPSSNPASTGLSLVVTYTANTSAAIRVRGANAYNRR